MVKELDVWGNQTKCDELAKELIEWAYSKPGLSPAGFGLVAARVSYILGKADGTA